MADHRASLGRPYTTRRPVPTIQRYYRTQKERREHAEQLARAEADALRDEPDSPAYPDDEGGGDHARREYDRADDIKGDPGAWPEADPADGSPPAGDGDAQDQGAVSTTSEAHGNGNEANLKRRRKHFQRRRRDKNSREREVTDPVTHLPVRIYDFQSSDLDRIPENLITVGTPYNRLTGVPGKGKTKDDLAAEAEEIDHYHGQLDDVFPLPAHDAIKRRLVGIYSTGVLIGLGSLVAVGYAIGTAERVLVARAGWFSFSLESAVATGGFFAVIYAVFAARQWIANRLDDIWEEELWQAKKEQAPAPKPKPGDDDDEYGDLESTRWLNDLLSSTWPLINPDLFLGASELLEDVMQASLPSVIRMVGVEDIGQGSEPINILGIKWLPTGAAMTSVKELSGPPTSASEFVEDVQVARGLEAEDGDFINMEVAFSYRPRTEKSDLVQLSGQSQNAHIYMGFYLPGRIKFPIYAHLKALVGKARMRLTLMPDPPFFSSVTLTLLGQPKVEIACMPLVQKGLNIMDLPLISSFVQSSVDAAVAEYVAPKSISVNLQDLLAGRDYKLDTRARGVICIHIKRAYGFKEGDQAIPLLRPEGSADPYVTCGWAKYVKPLWSTRVLLAEMQPVWDEMAFLMVTGEELDINERLRIQLWDSDRFTADDDLGRVELELQDLVRNPATVNRMQDRVDGFIALKATDTMPGTMEWSVGYFPKVPIQEAQLARQTAVPELRSIEALHERAEENSRRKLRGGPKIEDMEATKAADVKDMMDRMIASVPPSADHPSGILSVQIHEATGLEIRAHHNADRFNQGSGAVDNEEVESGEELPSAYCNIILNHTKIYRTRVKPKNARPFFNASTERFIRDWRTAELFVSVRDSRVHEDDGLMGLVYLPLRDVFRERSQVDKVYPLFGGMGYGRVRISVVFRPVGLQLERPLLGWDYGTLAVGARLVARGLPADLHGLAIKLDTALSSGHMYYTGPLAADAATDYSGDGPPRGAHGWATTGQQRPLHLGVRKRYASPLVLQFRKERRFRVDKTPQAFAVLWLQHLPDADDDEPTTTVTLPVWKGDLKRATTCALGAEGDESVTRVGDVTLQLAFHRGLGPAHAPLARREPNLANVVEVVETAAYQLRSEGRRSPSSVRRRVEDAAPAAAGVQTILGGDAPAGSEDSTASEDDEHDDFHDADGGGGGGGSGRAKESMSPRPKTSGGGTTTSGSSGGDEEKKAKKKSGDGEGKEEDEEDEDGSHGMREAWRQYRRNSKQTHRRHRGLMQFKSARTLWWMKHKVDGLQGRVAGGLGDHAGARERGTVVESEVR